jgi:ribosomal subunit interface protein
MALARGLPKNGDMRIPVTGKGVIITDQLQTYVEYRLFTSIARYQALIGGISVTLGHNQRNRGPFLCVVAVDLTSGGQMKIRASGAHPNAAIDRAADRTSLRLSRHNPQHVSS